MVGWMVIVLLSLIEWGICQTEVTPLVPRKMSSAIDSDKHQWCRQDFSWNRTNGSTSKSINSESRISVGWSWSHLSVGYIRHLFEVNSLLSLFDQWLSLWLKRRTNIKIYHHLIRTKGESWDLCSILLCWLGFVQLQPGGFVSSYHWGFRLEADYTPNSFRTAPTRCIVPHGWLSMKIIIDYVKLITLNLWSIMHRGLVTVDEENLVNKCDPIDILQRMGDVRTTLFTSLEFSQRCPILKVCIISSQRYFRAICFLFEISAHN